MIIESHAHYSHHKFDQTFRYLSYKNGNFYIEEGNRSDIIENLKKTGVAASVEPAIGIESNERVYQISGLYPDFIFPAYGCHPTRVHLAKWKDRKIIETYSLLSSDKCVAIGETGLDYHFERKDQHRFRQKRWFRYQIKLAFKLNKPLILHIRQASDDALKILRKYQKYLVGGVAHCFCDDITVARAYVELGLHVGIGAALLTDECGERLAEVIKYIPLDRVIVETDAPYVMPDIDLFTSNKQKYKVRNTSTTIFAVIERIAQIKNMSVSEVEEVLFDNAVRLLSINKENIK